jgi:activator of 2-hydroxyglutaryl-CoA dehydratase
MQITGTEKYIFIIDIGSTTTKGLLLEKRDGSYFFKAMADAPTTVERPFEDVGIGIKAL